MQYKSNRDKHKQSFKCQKRIVYSINIKSTEEIYFPTTSLYDLKIRNR